MKKAPFLLMFGVVAVALSLCRPAAAEWGCYDTGSYQLGCNGGFCTVDYCKGNGTTGLVCSCGYGVCNNQCNYKSCNASGPLCPLASQMPSHKTKRVNVLQSCAKIFNRATSAASVGRRVLNS